MFDNIKALFEMQKKMQEVKRELDKTTFAVASSDGLVKITMNGSQEIQQVEFPAGMPGGDPAQFGQTIKDTFNRSIKRSQEIAAQKMKEVAGLNLPGK
ncbi:MAG TPA: YbaB/EbfC family nucleoid-associated protein [Candidatus Omnitrophota bacterium]|nr:YbaB/EbfC family nucleoid-associated protein [Candidatus Omnitrophota bacterium]HRZ15472.1 YbaB/EbfC family nucleoid-associated protein [Candidatus Omnitrophota bacterium]